MLPRLHFFFNLLRACWRTTLWPSSSLPMYVCPDLVLPSWQVLAIIVEMSVGICLTPWSEGRGLQSSPSAGAYLLAFYDGGDGNRKRAS